MNTKIYNPTALMAALVALLATAFTYAITALTTNGSSESVFLQTLRWAGWKASNDAIDEDGNQKPNAAFLDTVPESVRGQVMQAITKIEAYFNHPKYNHVALATLQRNILGNAIRVFAGHGNADQIAAFSFNKKDVGPALLDIRSQLAKANDKAQGFTLASLADIFRVMGGSEPHTMYHYLTSTADTVDGLTTVVGYYIGEGPAATTPEAISERDKQTVAPMLQLEIPSAAQSVVPGMQQRQQAIAA
ncbi:MAG: hypothetical protein O3B47_00185 [bacterium]|nr:hypothetical protein [bacterium]